MRLRWLFGVQFGHHRWVLNACFLMGGFHSVLNYVIELDFEVDLNVLVNRNTLITLRGIWSTHRHYDAI